MRGSIALVAASLYFWLLPVSGRLPEEVVRETADFFAKRSVKEIRQAAAGAAAEQQRQLRAVLPLAEGELQKSLESSLTQAQNARDAEKQSEADVVADMARTIESARLKAVPEVARAADEFSSRRARADIARAERPILEATMAEESGVEDKRQEAFVTLQVAVAASEEMQELAREAHDVADRLNEAHAQSHAQAAKERNELAQAQAQQSLRIARTAGWTMHESIALANSALARAKEAERQAQQAVENARANAWSLEQLKMKAQHAFYHKSGGANLAQQHMAHLA